jgi:hypothetical protein
MSGAKPILMVSPTPMAGRGRLTGDAFDMSEAMLVGLKELVERDASVLALSDLPLGWSAWRERPGVPWVHRADSEQTAE